jgi:hypothetical protein
MSGSRALHILLGTLSAGACSGLLGANLALAGVRDNRLELAADGTNIEFEVKDTSRRDVFNQLFAGSGIEIKWVAAAFADERIGGKFSGTPAAVIRELLAQTNFIVVSADSSRVIRLVMVGPAKGDQSFSGLAALAGAIRLVATTKEPKSETIGGTPPQPETPKPLLKPQLAQAAPPPLELPKAASLDGTSAPPERPGPPPKPQAAGARPATAELPNVSSSQSPAAPLDKPPSSGAAAGSPGAAPIARPEVSANGSAESIMRPAPEGATAPPLVATQAPSLIPPPEGVTALPLSPPPPGAVAPELRPPS